MPVQPSANLTPVLSDPALRSGLERRLWSKVERRGPDDCWHWTGAIKNTGYGVMNSGRNDSLLAHRVSYALIHGDPKSLFVCHRCDNPRCCNPAHLFAGTHTDNVRDAIAKGRRVQPERPFGSSHPMAKLDEAKVRAIRSDGRLLKEIAADYGVSCGTISRIKYRRIWKKTE